MPLAGLSFVKTLVTFEVIYTTEPVVQSMTKIVSVDSPSISLTINSAEHAELRAPIFFKG